MVCLFTVIIHYRIEMTIDSKRYTKVILLENSISSGNQDFSWGFKDLLLIFHLL